MKGFDLIVLAPVGASRFVMNKVRGLVTEP